MGDFIIGRTQDRTHTHTLVRPFARARAGAAAASAEKQQRTTSNPKASRPFLDFAQFKIRFLSSLETFLHSYAFFGCIFLRWINELFFSRQTIFTIVYFRFSATLSSPGNMREKESRSQDSGASLRKNRLSSLVALTHSAELINEHDEFDYVFQPDPPAPVAASEFSPKQLYTHTKTTENIQQQCQMEILLLLLFLFQAFLFFFFFPALADRQAGH
jgi:hypothetical protein